MTDTEPRQPWLTIIGIGEDGATGLCGASKKALAAAEVIFGSPRQLDLVNAGPRGQAFPVPFDLSPVTDRRGTPVVMLASGDPFWFGAGGSVAIKLALDEWVCYPGSSTFSLAASRLGWKLDETACMALHAQPVEILRPFLQAGQKFICLIRDGFAAGNVAEYLGAIGFADTRLRILEALGGPRERVRTCDLGDLPDDLLDHPVAVAFECAAGPGLSLVPGRVEDVFHHDGQITKSPVRAVTLSSLAPREGEILWDLGAGSGAISVEWCLASKHGQALAVEAKADRVANIEKNIREFGLQRRISVITGKSQDCLDDLLAPDAIFIGGGASKELIDRLWSKMRPGARLVVNAVTIETEALITAQAAEKGGDLLRLDLSRAKPIGPLRGWQAAYPVTQWLVSK